MGACLLVALLLPALAILPSAVVDRGPDGRARVSPFPIAIAAFDPFVWTCARNSAAVASAVAAGSLAIGVGLALLVHRRRFWGRTVLWALAILPLAGGPLLIAPGVETILGGDRGREWLAARSILGISADGLVRWAALVWVGLASGVPLVALATGSALRRVDPAWVDAARGVGAARGRVWREIVWPILRPTSARAASMVFTLALVEPAGPLILGLRRTLAVQMLGAATRDDQPTRAATLALLSIAIAAAGRILIGWWGGRSCARDVVPDAQGPAFLGFRRASAASLTLLTWILFALGPFLAFLLGTLGSGRSAISGSWTDLVRGWLVDPDLGAWALNSSLCAGLAIGFDLAILGSLRRGRSGAILGAVRLAGRLFEAVPPLALGTGALALPWLLAVLADSLGGPAGTWLRAVARELSPARSPGILLILGLAAIRLPMLARSAEVSGREIRPARVDAARIVGASDRRARKAVDGRWLGIVPGGSAILALALASTNLAPALLLTPSSGRRTLAPALLRMSLDGGPVDPRAACLVLAILALNAVGLALASRAREGPIGEWFRG